MTRLTLWLDELGRATAAAEKAEQAYRADFARRVAALADDRAVAYRRANLMRALAEAIAATEDEESAVAHGLAVFRTRLGWSSDSEARAEILARFAPVCAAAFGALQLSPGGPAEHDLAPHPENLNAKANLSLRHAEERPEAASRSTHDRGASFETPAAQAPQDDAAGSSRPRSQEASEGEGSASPDPAAALAGFETWYVSAKGTSFWILFENVMPETPLVDF